MAKIYYKRSNQEDAYSSPWKRSEALKIRIWEVVWILLIRWLPKKASGWYKMWLRIFGCNIKNRAFIHPSAKIYAPWLFTIGDRSCLGFKCEIYNLGSVEIGERVTMAQYSYVCNGTHNLSDERLQLMVGDVKIGNDVFVGAKAMILPGLIIADGCVIGAGSVLANNTEEMGIYAGNPAKLIKKRTFNHTNHHD